MPWEIHAATRYADYAADWDRLNAELYRAHPFFDSRFIGPALVYFGKGDEQLCLHRGADGIDGALILRRVGVGRWALFLPEQAQIGAVLVPHANMLADLFAALPGRVWMLELLALDPHYSPAWAGLTLPRRVTFHALTIAVATAGEFADYWGRRPRHLVKNLRRYRRRSDEEFGGARFAERGAVAEIDAAVGRYAALEETGWKAEIGTAITRDNAQRHFYTEVLSRFAASGQAQVAEMYAGDKLCASRLMIANEAMSIILKTTYDETCAAIAPGRQLLLHVLERSFAERRVAHVEFYTNATPDQLMWADSGRHIRHSTLFRNEGIAALHAALRLMRRVGRGARQRRDALAGTANQFQVSAPATLAGLPPHFAALFDAAVSDGHEFGRDWFANLQAGVYGGDDGVRYYCGELHGAAKAILPVRLSHRGRVRTVEALSNYYTSLYAPLIAVDASTDDLKPLLQAATREHGGADEMRFAPMDPESPAYEAMLTALRATGWIPFRYFCFGNWTLAVASDWKSYLAARSGMLRSTLKRMGKKFAEAGGRIEVVAAPADVERATSAYLAVFAASWKNAEPHPDFIPGLIASLAASGRLRLGIAWLGERPIAAQIWIVCGRKASIFKLAYHEDFAAYSPGSLLTAHLMRHVIDIDGVGEVDYLIGDDPYKQAWMSHRRERWGIVAYNPRTLLGTLLLVREVAGRVGKHVIRRFSRKANGSAAPGGPRGK